MQCPQCSLEGFRPERGCLRCGVGRGGAHSRPLSLELSPATTKNNETVFHILEVETVLNGRYRLQEPLQIAGNQKEQPAAWLALDTRDRQRVEIRQVQFYNTPSLQRVQVLSDLVSRLRKLNQHPCLPHILDTFENQNNYYIVSQHIEGTSLAALMKQRGGALPERIVADFGRQLCEVLLIFSRQQPMFIHGAISPENIIVSLDSKRIFLNNLPPVLSDKLLQAGNAAFSELSGYHAPEQTRTKVNTDGITISADLYAIAATMHHAVTGYNPGDRMAFFYPPARRLNPNVSQSIEEILTNQLRLSPSQRYPRPADMQADLANFLLTTPLAEENMPVRPISLAPLNIRRQRQSSRNHTLISVTVVGMLVLLVAIVPFFFAFKALNFSAADTQAPQLAQQRLELRKLQAHEKEVFDKKGIGLSDGRYVFDTFEGRGDSEQKKQAAQSIQKNDLSNAINQINEAVLADPTDAEALVYQENLRIQQTGAPAVTIVIGLALDKDPLDLGPSRESLQGAYLAQYQINRDNWLPNGLQVRMLIDNSGADRGDVVTVAQLVVDRIKKAGNLDIILGVVGWPFSSETINARDIIASAHIPLIASTASSTKLSGSSPYFFRVNPADDQQGKTLGQIAIQQNKAKRILILQDKKEPYSVSLADAFTATVSAQGVQVFNDYFSAGATTVADYQHMVDEVVNNNVDLIFLAGFDIDAIRLATAVGQAHDATPLNALLTKLKILGGDGLSTNLILGIGNNVDAQLAAANQQYMSRLQFTSFAHPDEWAQLNVPTEKRPLFYTNWKDLFQASSTASKNAPPPGYSAILAADAVLVMGRAASKVKGEIIGEETRKELVAFGQNGVAAFQGISGRISFDPKGNPVDKAMVWQDVEQGDDGKYHIRLKQITGTFQ